VRVLLVHNRYRDPGGEERHVELLGSGLSDLGVDTFSYFADSSTLTSRRARLGAALGLAYNPGAGRRLDKALLRMRPEVVHFHNIWPLLTPAALRAARRSGAAIVLTIHNYRFACPAGTLLRQGQTHDDCIDGSSLRCGLRNARGRRLESVSYGVALEVQRRMRMLERWVEAFIAPSQFVAEMMRRAGLPEARIHVIRHGVRLASAQWCARQPRPLALYASRLSPEKGVGTLLEAARHVSGGQIVVAGDGPLAADVRAAQAPALRYLGRVGAVELADLRADALFTVVPSTCCEVSPYAAIESLAAGRAIVGSRIGGIPEFAVDGETGVLVEPGDANGLAQAITQLWHNPSYALELGARARAYAEREFDLRSQSVRMLRLYEQLLETR
jgi:glycosyltransferase involved in cell wall biosynthesis